jgi:phage terminase large subunit-like protein
LSVADTRLEPNAIEVILMTLWHPDDLGCRIIRSWEKSPIPYKIVRLPALAEDNDPLGRAVGDPLWPERFDKAALEEKRRKSVFWWDALYRQNPTPEGGAIFKAAWFQRYVTVNGAYPNRCWRRLDTGKLIFQNACVTFAIVDPALGKTTTGDDTAITVFAFDNRDEGELLVLHCTSERIPVSDLIGRLEEIAKAWNVQWIGMEANGFQLLLANSARKEIGITVRELQPEGRSKLSRAVPAIEKAAAGKISLPDEPGHDWVSQFLQQLSEWTGMDGDKDDIVDTVSYGVIESGRYGGKMAVLPSKKHVPLFTRRHASQGRSLFGGGR